MCFSPQPRAYFRHLNFKKWSRTVSFLTFSLPNVLFATAACNFWCILSAPTSAPAALTGLLFDWPDTRIYEKTQHFVTSLTFSADVASFFLLSRYCMFFLLTSFCWLDYSTPLFNFPYCRKFLFKLPSTIHGSVMGDGKSPKTGRFWNFIFVNKIIVPWFLNGSLQSTNGKVFGLGPGGLGFESDYH